MANTTCGHPADVYGTCCANRLPKQTERQRMIDHLDAKLFGLNVHGKTDEDREEAARVFEQLQALRREERGE